MITFKEPIEFIWNKGSIDKNWEKHKVSNRKCEEVFFDKNKKVYKDKLHSNKEERFILIGKTKKKRLLYTVFAIRRKEIRIISARDINKKERRLYR